MRNTSICTLFTMALLLTNLAACSGGESPAGSAAPSTNYTHSALPLKGVTVGAFFDKTPLSGIRVEMYIGKAIDSCPPFRQQCIKKATGLDSGTTGSDGTVELKGRYSRLEIICVQAYNAKKFSMLQECDKNFPNTVSLQFNL
jgi:hypothetical protein